MWEMWTETEAYPKTTSFFKIQSMLLKEERPVLNNDSKEIPFEIKSLIINCWDQNPDNRPSFTEIVKILKKILKKKENQN
jgi:hypothetical protein